MWRRGAQPLARQRNLPSRAGRCLNPYAAAYPAAPADGDDVFGPFESLAEAQQEEPAAGAHSFRMQGRSSGISTALRRQNVPWTATELELLIQGALLLFFWHLRCTCLTCCPRAKQVHVRES